MADQVEMQDIRGLDIDKLAKGFAEEEYTMLAECQVSSMTGDSIRWYQKTAGTLTATSPSEIKNVSPLSVPATLEVSWTRNTSYPKKYFVEGFISMEDIKSADLDVLATTLRDLTRSIVKARNDDVWDVLSESQSPSNIQTFATTAIGGDQWDAASAAGNPVLDLLHAKKLIYDNYYNPEGATLLLDPLGYRHLVDWLITGKGSSIPGFSSEKIKTGVVMQILGLNVKVSTSVTTDYAMVIVPKRAATYKEQFAITSRIIKEEGIGSKIRVWTAGITYVTDPKCIVLISDINT